MARFGKAISEAKEELMIFFFAAIMLLYLSGVGIYYFEHEVQPENFGSIVHSLWWALATLTTVGYGDVVSRNNGRQAVYVRHFDVRPGRRGRTGGDCLVGVVKSCEK